jgi:ArsR family transcriptional regulator
MRDRLHSRDCARYLKALADPERLKIVQCLQDGPKNVGELSAILEQELDEKQGKHVAYSLHSDISRPGEQGQKADVLDLGCCRLELGGR